MISIGRRVRPGTLALGILTVIAAVTSLSAQITDFSADRVLGQGNFSNIFANPLDGVALPNPQAVAVDNSSTPNHLYVADEQNSRVLGWANAAAFVNGAPADIVIGQPDFFSWGCNDGIGSNDVNGTGPDSLCNPTGLAVDEAGNLYVADYGDSRVLEYTAPFSSGQSAGISANLVFGQHGDFTGSQCCLLDADTLLYPQGVAIDSAGNLYIADTGNNRVLE